jgi:uncharacterized RDD family membrane protein YckC
LRVSEALDTVVQVETPEGIVLELRPAGLVVRFYAFAIDWLIRLSVLYAVAMITVFMGGIGMALWLILLFACEWVYPIVFELGGSGATPGKRVFNLKVVMDNGLPVTPAASITRNLLRVADFLPFAFGFAIISILWRRDYKRLGDMAAATLVVHQPRPAPQVDLPDVAPLTPVVALTPGMQAALIAFAARAPRLTEERLDELAAIAASVTGDARRSGSRVTRRVLGVAQWALGRRA